MKKEKSRIQIALDLYEKVFTDFKNAKAAQSNKYPVGDPNRIEHDLSEVEKAHLDLLRTCVDVQIAVNNSSLSSHLNKLTRWVVGLTIVIAAATVVQALPALETLFICNKN